MVIYIKLLKYTKIITDENILNLSLNLSLNLFHYYHNLAEFPTLESKTFSGT